MIGISILFAYCARGSSGQRAGFLGCVDKCPFWEVEWVRVVKVAAKADMTGMGRVVKNGRILT